MAPGYYSCPAAYRSPESHGHLKYIGVVLRIELWVLGDRRLQGTLTHCWRSLAQSARYEICWSCLYTAFLWYIHLRNTCDVY